MQAHYLARNFQSKVGTASSLTTTAAFCRVIPGSYSEGPRATCRCLGWGDGGAGQHQPCVSPAQFVELSSPRDRSVPSCPPWGAELPAEEPFPPALRAGALGRRWGCRAALGPAPRSGSLAGAAQLPQSRGRGAHGRAGKVLWAPGPPPLLPSLPFQPAPLAASSTACGAFSQSPGARGKVGTGSARALSARVVIVSKVFWLSSFR